MGDGGARGEEGGDSGEVGVSSPNGPMRSGLTRG